MQTASWSWNSVITLWQKLKHHLRTHDRLALEQDNPLITLAEEAYPPNSGNRKPNYYLDFYHRIFKNRRLEQLSLLEIGVADGASLRMWRDYFPNAKIVGLDIIAPSTQIQKLQGQNKISYVQGSQSDEASLAKTVRLTGGAGFDVIIDDAAHVGALSKASFGYLFNNGLKPGALYFIEDLGTAYFADWSDSRTFADTADIVDSSGTTMRFPSHDYGMIGFLKQLVDELHGAYIRGKNQRYPITFITLIPHVAMIGKSPAKPSLTAD
jgi:hypothetical protein